MIPPEAPLSAQPVSAIDPEVAALARTKRRMSLWLTAALIVIYGLFLALVSFAPDFMARPAGPVTLGILIAAATVVGFCVLSSLYVIYANRLHVLRGAAQQAERSRP